MAEIMDQLTQKEPNVPTNCNPGFWSKLSKPLPFGTKALLNDNVESVVDGNGPLHLAASNWTEPVDFCRTLLDKFPSAINSVNDRLETPLILASRAGPSLGDIPSSLELYYTYFTDVTRTGRLYAGSTEDKELEILQIIGDNTPAMSSVGQIKGYFYTPLRIAVQSMSPRLAACIWDAMERKAASVGLEIPWNRGEYTYDLPALAIKRNSPEMLEYILKRGATMGYTDLDAQLLFDLANGPDSTELLHILVQYGLDFGHRNPSGFLPLHVAIIRGNLKLAQTLVDFMTDEEFEMAFRPRPL
ncbi:hypothetical protein GQ53DRAFT_852095 [Thozetella sp. PMI_491]|nr:hypothetical protein GQ53DRAFT_852095 [Thozetella sp. PMI_491]